MNKQILTSLFLLTCLFICDCGSGLTPARDLSGTWKSALPCTWYAVSWEDGLRTIQYTGNLEMQLTQSGNSLIGDFYLTPTSSTRLNYNLYVPPISPVTVTATISSSAFSWQTTDENWEFTFTTDLIQGRVVNRVSAMPYGFDSDNGALKLVRQ